MSYKDVEHIDIQRVSQCSAVFRVEKWNAFGYAKAIIDNFIAPQKVHSPV